MLFRSTDEPGQKAGSMHSSPHPMAGSLRQMKPGGALRGSQEGGGQAGWVVGGGVAMRVVVRVVDLLAAVVVSVCFAHMPSRGHSPGWQAVGLLALAGQNVPALQGIGVDDPAGQYVPHGQPSAAHRPVLGHCLPGVQSRGKEV